MAKSKNLSSLIVSLVVALLCFIGAALTFSTGKVAAAERKALYKNAVGGEQFSYSANADGWAAYTQDFSTVWVDGSSVETIHNYYGYTSSFNTDGITHLKFLNNSYIANYNGFDVTKPITIYFNYSAPDYNNLTEHNKVQWSFGFYDDLSTGLKAGASMWNLAGTNTKLYIQSANDTKDAAGYDRSDVYKKLRLVTTAEGHYSDAFYGDDYSITTWNKSFHKLVLNIGENSTIAQVDNQAEITLNTLKRSTFGGGEAYLVLTASAAIEFNLAFTQPDESALYKSAFGGEKFTYNQNGDAWSNFIKDGYAYKDIYDNEVLQSNYGAQSTLYADGTTHYTFNSASYVARYQGFDVNQPITLYFNASAPDPDNLSAHNKIWWAFSLFDSLKTGLKAGQSMWNIGGTNNKLLMMSANAEKDSDGNPRSDVFKKMRFVTAAESKYSDAYYGDDYSISNWNKSFHKIYIVLGDASTTIQVDDQAVITMTTITKSTFADGIAYLVFTASAASEFNFATSQPDESALYKNSFAGAKYDYAANGDGWSTYIKDGYIYRNVYEDEILHSNFGAVSTAYAGESTHVTLDNSYIANYTAFDVTKPITIYFNASAPDENNLSAHNKAWWGFGIFNDLQKGLKAGNGMWNIGAYGTDLFLMSANAAVDSDGNPREDILGKFRCVTRAGGDEENRWTDSFIPGNYSISNWNATYHKLVILIGESNTTIQVDNLPVVTMETLTRATFVNGTAYLTLTSSSAVEFNVAIDSYDAEVLYKTVFGGEEFDCATDANGWSTYAKSSYTYVDCCSYPVINDKYGLTANSITDGYSDISLDTSYLLNYNAIDVSKPIRIVYRFEAPDASDFDTRSFITIALFDNLRKGFLTGTNSWMVSPDMATILMQTANSDFMHVYGDMSAIYGKLYIKDYAAETTYSANVLPTPYDSTTWQKDVVVDIFVGTASTKLFVNGVETITFNSVSLSSFTDGTAYIGLANGNKSRVQIKVLQPTASDAAMSLTLSEDLILSYGVNLGGKYYAPQAEITFMEETTTVENYTFVDGTYIFKYAGVTPRYLNEGIDLNITAINALTGNRETVFTKNEYSVRDYLETLLGLYSDDDKQVTLIVDILNYGAAIQTYTNTALDDLANKNLTVDQRAMATPFDASAATDILSGTNTSDFRWESANIVFDSKAEIEYKISVLSGELEINDITVRFTVNGREYLVALKDCEYKNGKYYVRFSGFGATEFADKITAEMLYHSQSTGAYAEYSVNSYVKRSYEKSVISDVVKALFSYGAGAKAYKG